MRIPHLSALEHACKWLIPPLPFTKEITDQIPVKKIELDAMKKAEKVMNQKTSRKLRDVLK